MTKSRGILSPRQLWTDDEEAVLRDLYPDCTCNDIAALLGRRPGSIYQAGTRLGIQKSPKCWEQDYSGRVQRGNQSKSMIATQFKKGAKPWNTGTHFCAGGRSIETRFKKGQMSAGALRRWVPVGSYRVNGDGYLDQKVTDLGLGPRDWVAVHRLVWVKAHGAIPQSHVVTFKPGRRTTVLEQITIDALECINRAELARRNHPRSKSPELAALVQLKGAITRQVNRIAREQKELQTP